MSMTENADSNSIREKIRNFVIDRFLLGTDPGSLHDDDSFLETGLIDSTGVLELIGFIEGTFGIRIQEEEMVPDNLDSLALATAFVCGKL
jgi:acyl carrier protein